MPKSSYRPLTAQAAAPEHASKPLVSIGQEAYRVSTDTHPPRYYPYYGEPMTARAALHDLGAAVQDFATRYFEDVEPFDIRRENGTEGSIDPEGDGAIDKYYKHFLDLKKGNADKAQLQAAGAQLAGILVRYIATLAKSVIDDKQLGRRPTPDALKALSSSLSVLYDALEHVSRRDPQPLFHDTDEAIIEMASGIHKRTPNAKEVVEEEVGELAKAVAGVIASERALKPEDKDKQIIAHVQKLYADRWKKIESALNCFDRVEDSMHTLLQTRPYILDRDPSIRTELQPLFDDFMSWARIRIGIRGSDVGAFEEATENFKAAYLRLMDYRVPNIGELSKDAIVGGERMDVQWEARRLMLDIQMGAALVKDMVFRRQDQEKGTAAFETLVHGHAKAEGKILHELDDAAMDRSHREAQLQRRETAAAERKRS